MSLDRHLRYINFYTSSKTYPVYFLFHVSDIRTFETFDNKEQWFSETFIFFVHFYAFSPRTYFWITLYIRARPGYLDSTALFPTSRVTCLAKKFRVISGIHAIWGPVYGSTRGDTRSRVLLEPTCTHESRDTPCRLRWISVEFRAWWNSAGVYG